MKRIGFIDYYLSEWHANNYPGWIKQANEKLGTDYRVSYAYAELDVSPVDGVNTDEWCEKYSAARCKSIDELCEKSDVILILAPSNPEKHLAYAKQALKYSKRTYIDKTFAPDEKTAKKIFDEADAHGTSVFSTSALRYASELSETENSGSIAICGGGSNLEEYIVHQAEMAVKLIRSNPVSFKCKEAEEKRRVFSVKFENGAKATFTYSPELTFCVGTESDGENGTLRKIESDTFGSLISDILRFYETGIPSFEREQTMQVMRLRDGILKAEKERRA